MKIALQTLASGLFGVVFFGLLLFLPAGTLNYWQAWVFIAVFIAATMIPSIYLAVKNPEALRRRMKAGPMAETRTVQRVVISGTILMVLAVTVVSSLDHRFGWSQVPTAVIVLGNVVVAVGLVIAQLVVIQNSYAAATITVEAEQKVVSTGLYGVVRHPMYVGTLIMMIGMPLALDSYWGLVSLIPGLAILAIRIVDEEKMLREGLAGYPITCSRCTTGSCRTSGEAVVLPVGRRRGRGAAVREAPPAARDPSCPLDETRPTRVADSSIRNKRPSCGLRRSRFARPARRAVGMRRRNGGWPSCWLHGERRLNTEIDIAADADRLRRFSLAVLD